MVTSYASAILTVTDPIETEADIKEFLTLCAVGVGRISEKVAKSDQKKNRFFTTSNIVN